MAGHGRPERIVHDDRLRPRECAAQARDVLMVMEGIAAAPVDEPDVGIGQPAPVEVERLTRTEEHVRDARERDEVADRVAALRQRWRTDSHRRASDVAERAVALTEAAPG